ncbi:DotD/TraH family lipoprotein [Sulfitobacter sp. 1A13353]|uniref:DotD/TraH family lipoprotein n=1 Tax=Sulfitobacter sp. 1A13353 TaxID=3368568 RepID=UPI0037461303
MSKKALILSLMAAAAVSACATQQTEDIPQIVEVEEKIAEAVDKASNANTAIAEVEVATAAPVRAAPGAEIPANVVLPPESIQPITVDWNGPVESFLEDISQRAGYELVVTGRAPANQVMISINANNEPLFGVVRRAGNMVHGYADIGFNPGSKKIELRYGG